jgi:signal transduction histidine kinase
LAATKAITLEEDLPGGLTLSGDMDLLIRLFLNLLDNALKYTLENGRVVIAAGGDAESIQIMISDSGPGIPAEHLPHLFERFYRVEDDRARLSSVTSNQLPVTSDQLPVTSDLRPQRSALPVTSQQPPDTEHWTLDTEHVRLAAGRRSLNTEYRPGGAGLGLAIAYEIARAHGGTLDVQSAPGEGTTAVVQLPRNKPLSPLGD